MRKLFNRLGFRVTLPLILIWLLLGGALFYSTQGAISRFLDDNVREDMRWISRGALKICSDRLEELIRSGRAGDRRADRIARNRAMLDIEELLRNFDTAALIVDNNGETLFSSGLPFSDEELQRSISSDLQLTHLRVRLQTFYAYRFQFEPWGWKLALLRPPEAYQNLQQRIGQIYVAGFIILTLAMLMVALMIHRSVNRPLNLIIRQLKRGERPTYTGVQELEFLSSSIRENINHLRLEIGERRQAETELRALQDLMSNIVNAMPSLLIGVDEEGLVMQWNSEAVIRTGLAVNEALGQKASALLPQLGSRSVDIERAMRTFRVHREESVLWEEQEEKRYADITVYPLTVAEKRYAIIRIDDVTEKVRMVEAMVQSEKMMSVGGLAAGMAHEIKNPLGGILQNAQLMESRIFGSLKKNRELASERGIDLEALKSYLAARKVDTMISAIRDAGIRATAIIDNMLSFSGRGEASFACHDLRDLLDRTVEIASNDYDLSKRYDFRQVRITRDYPLQGATVECEGSKIQQVFLNIIKNAAEAMAEAETGAPSLQLKIESRAEQVRVSICDNGPGIPAEISRRIFEPFFTTKAVGIGTGLGLSISYFIITDNHKGQMSYEAAEQGGSRFIIELPVQQQPAS